MCIRDRSTGRDYESMAEEAALEFKNQGNAQFKDGNMQAAVDLYTQGIEVFPIAALFNNRAMAQLRMENWGSVIEDTSSALGLDPTNAKASYRKGCAFVGLGKLKEAAAAFKLAVELEPKDRVAKEKLKECRKELKKQAFAEAISGDHDIEIVCETFNPEDIVVDDSYKGPRMPNPLTPESVIEMMEWFKNENNIHRRYAFEILVAMRKKWVSAPSLTRVEFPEGQKVTVCGDTHGQFYDLLNIFELNGYPSLENRYLFNGDYVDRGSFSCEVALTLFAWQLALPEGCVNLSRGNHETQNMNKIYGFEGETVAKYTDRSYTMFTEVFNVLPLAHLINNQVFCVHGGLFSQDGVKLEDIEKIKRDRQPPDDGIMCDCLWSDPQDALGRAPSKRGVSMAFGPDVTQNFLETNNLKMVIRSHEVKDEGYEIHHGGKLVTVFSAPNYCDQMGNKGAYIHLDHECNPTFNQFDAVPHPAVRPMAYASNGLGSMFRGFGM
eukprot:TRINITY_DN1930_c0_g1_i1.p1 TRINITY_DN1930_c0_g1~~TRINITY_DN1930_c0_g1_i1.p1  ORF type:complete len:494 (-),score=144.25 TRINITY_DN1930_c0_g1_i1:235-1716(-)